MSIRISVELLAEALTAIGIGDECSAISFLDNSSARGSIMAKALREILRSGSFGNAYDQPSAFERFIRGGGNVPLYAAVSTELVKNYNAFRPNTLLDIGSGDGMALLPALNTSKHRFERVDVVEPNHLLLKNLLSSFPNACGYQMSIEEFLENTSREKVWGLAHATFSLQSLPKDSRMKTLAALAERVDRLLIVEFDVPVFVVESYEYYKSLASRYERAASEYLDDAALVAGGFLAPMLLGQIRSITPSNYEQPASEWIDEIERSGYEISEVSSLYDYSWAPAFAITAMPRQ